jgi:dTDP-4-dehydrorhamnose reductase
MEKPEIDLSKPDELGELLRNRDFDCLINAAAYTAVDQAEEEYEVALRINGVSPGIMAEVCKEKEAPFIHISTDYVFAHDWNRPLKEDDPVNPLNAYGRSKLKGEESIRAALPKHVIIRTSWLYGIEGHNFPKNMLRLAENRDQINVVFDQVGNPTFAADLARAIRDICASGLNQSHQFGTFHYSNEGVCSWYDFARYTLNKKFPQVEVNPVTSDQFPTPARRPNYSVLNKKKIKDTFGLKIRHWQDALDDFLENI